MRTSQTVTPGSVFAGAAKGRLKIEEVRDALEDMALDPEASLEQRPFVQIALQIEGPQPGIRTKLDEICLDFAIRDVAPDIAWPGQKSERKNLERLSGLANFIQMICLKRPLSSAMAVSQKPNIWLVFTSSE